MKSTSNRSSPVPRMPFFSSACVVETKEFSVLKAQAFAGDVTGCFNNDCQAQAISLVFTAV
jgi:hypothetical protein